VYKIKWTTVKDAERWAIDTFEKGVDDNKTIEEATKKLISETRKVFCCDEQGNADFITILWSASKMLIPYNPIACLFCLKKINTIAKSSYSIAISLLRSQTKITSKKKKKKKKKKKRKIASDGSINSDLAGMKFSSKLNPYIIESAVHMLKSEKNRNNMSAKLILENFVTGNYPSVFKRFAEE